MTVFQLKVVKLKNDFDKISGATVKDLKAALYQEAETIMTASKRDYVPIKTGALRNSGTVYLPEEMPDRVQVRLGFGGASAPYAAIVHEYPKSYGQGKNKYLSIPLGISAKNMASRIAEKMKRAARSRR